MTAKTKRYLAQRVLRYGKIMDDLFCTSLTLEPIPLEDAELYYLRQLPLVHNAEAVMKQLIDEVPWRTDNIVVCGKTYP